MHLFFSIGNLAIPSYGVMISLGVVVANIVALYVIRRTKQDVNNFILVEAYSFLGGFIGAKVLYLIVSFSEIDWSKIFRLSYFNSLMQGGFVFYGGLIGGLLFAFLAGKIHRFHAFPYIERFIFLIPMIHAFGRIGCFLTGCCFGIPYHGIGGVVFPKNSYAIPGIALFPVQLLESGILMLISILLIYLQFRRQWQYSLELYLVLYAIARFILEYLRYDAERGRFWIFSTSQWISIFMIVASLLIVRFRRSFLQNEKIASPLPGQ
jgi:phosphatidylglycerol:prolipoprotein diacylglycerol transferase